MKFTIDTNNLLKFIKVRELEDLSLNKLLENWESKVIDNKNQLEDNNKFKEIDIAQWVGITLLPLNSCVSKIDVYETAFFDFFKGYNDGKYYLGAFEIERRVYFLINNFPIDSGIRIPPEENYPVHLGDEWKDLAQVSREAVLCYLPVKKENLR